jgi:RNA polymerase sigma-70 factor (ECF subfamily)
MALVECIPHLRAFARSLTRNREQADDLVHDAVVHALAAESQFCPGTNFKAWIFTILRNLFYNRWREQRIRSTLIEDPVLSRARVGPPQEAALKIRDFKRAFWRLGQDQREALILVGASGMSYEEAAAVCGCPVGTVKSRVSRARQQLMHPFESPGSFESTEASGDAGRGDGKYPRRGGARRQSAAAPSDARKGRRPAPRPKESARRASAPRK